MQNSQNKACRLNSTQIFFHNWKLNHRGVKLKACDVVRSGHPGNSKGPASIPSAWPDPSQRAHMCAGGGRRRRAEAHPVPSQQAHVHTEGRHLCTHWMGWARVCAGALMPARMTWDGPKQHMRPPGWVGQNRSNAGRPLTRTATLTSLSGVCVHTGGGEVSSSRDSAASPPRNRHIGNRISSR